MRSPGAVLTFLLAVSSPLVAQITVTTTSLPFGGLFQDYSATLMASGGSGSYTWSIISGSLPPGIFFNTDQGHLSGNPSAAGMYTFKVQAVDTQTPTMRATKQLSIGIIQISTPPQLPNGDTCTFYSQQFAVSNGPRPPFVWSFSDSQAPPGLTLDPSSGVLTGKPTVPGNYQFSIVAFSPGSNINAIQGFSLTISSLCFITNTLPNGDLGSFYRQSLVVSGGTPPYVFGVQTGSLPTGLTLDANSGLLSGTPTVAGAFTFTLRVTDSSQSTTTLAFSVTISAALAFTTTSPLPSATAGTSYSQTFTATGGTAPYVFTTSNPPAALELSPSGVLSGVPTAGVFSFTVTLTDAGHNSTKMDFRLTVITSGPVLQVTPLSLTFNAPLEGDAPPPQFIDVMPVGTAPVDFGVQIDGGSVDTPAPSWILVKPVNATAPARLVVTVNQGDLAAQTSIARVRVNDVNGNAIIVMVTLNVVSSTPQLQVVPATLHFAARSATPGILVGTLAIRNTGGGGPISFSAFVQNNSSWITGVTTSSGRTAPNSAVFLNVQINTQGLQVGSYHDVILFSSSGGNIQVPVALFVSGNGAILDLSVTGIRFQARTGGGFSNQQTLQILDVGDPSSSLAWTAEFVSGAQYFADSAASGTATPTNPGMLIVTPNADALQLQPGGYYGLLKISSTQALNSPQYVVLVLDLADGTTPPLPDPSPGGLVFIGTAGQPLNTGQVINVNTSTTSTASFQLATLTANGGNWLTATPGSGTATGNGPGEVIVNADPSQLPAGIYSGEVDISMSGVLRSVNITLIAQPPSSTANLARPSPHATVNCSPAALAITETGLVNNFGVPAGWPAALTVQLNDDCGNLVSNGSVAASFSNGDPSLMLRGGQPGTYSATWQPGAVSSQMAVTIQAQAAQLKPAIAQLTGGINQNPNAPPVLNQNGTVNTFYRVPAGALAPGMIVEVYGTGLATTSGDTGMLPLPTSFQGTSLIVGPYQAPLYYVSGGQVNVQFDAELAPDQQYPVIAMLNGALSVPVLTDISLVQLGVASQSDGHVIAEHGSDSSYVDASHPAKPGEILVIYLSGMGPTDPSVKSGTAAPGSEPLARVTNPVSVTLEGQPATVQFAGLTPGLVGLYQVNFVVPSNAGTGDLTLIVTQNRVPSNATRLPVSQ